jgi:predicted outer membrane repeat protein
VVNQLTDQGDGTCDGTCTLRDAIETADDDPAADTITFESGLSGEISLYDTGGYNPLHLETPMTIAGPGADEVAVSGGGHTLVFLIDEGGNQAVTISGLTIRDGAENLPYGAGIFSYGDANLTLDRDVFINNRAALDGGAINSYEDTLTVTDSTFLGNYAKRNGGAIFAKNSDVMLDHDDVAQNNSAEGQGAISARGGSLSVSDSTFSLNTGGSGGAIQDDARLVVRDSTFTGNSAVERGGAIRIQEADSALVSGSTIIGNDAAAGGGLEIVLADGEATIQDSTITGNTASTGAGLTVYSSADDVKIDNSTIAGNTASIRGGGIVRYVEPPRGSVSLSSTIVAGNHAPAAPDLGQRPNPATGPVLGAFILGHSLIGDTAGGAVITQAPMSSNLLNVDPRLGPLAANGGPTETMLPALASPAIDTGIANSLTVDQRGLARTVVQGATSGDGTDIGAVELADTDVYGAKVKAKKKQPQKGAKIVIVIKAGAKEKVTALAKGEVDVKKKSYKLKQLKKKIAATKTAKLKLKLKKHSDGAKIADALDSREKVAARLKVKLTDHAGNSITKKPKVKLKG